jgi:hypothetical protein
MKKERYPFTFLFWLTAIVLAVGFGCCLTSCAASKTKQNSHVDSLSQTQEKRDTASLHDSAFLHKDQAKQKAQVSASVKREEMAIYEFKEETEYDSAGKVKKFTKTTKQTNAHKDSSGNGIAWIFDHSKSDSSGYQNRDTGSHAKQGSTQLHKDESSKQVKGSNRGWLWWLLLIPVGYLVWDNRSLIWGLLSGGLEWIKRIVVKLFTGP